jgi:hypothetical protein
MGLMKWFTTDAKPEPDPERERPGIPPVEYWRWQDALDAAIEAEEKAFDAHLRAMTIYERYAPCPQKDAAAHHVNECADRVCEAEQAVEKIDTFAKWKAAQEEAMRVPVAILNASVVTADGTYTVRSISLEEARRLVRENRIDSAVGHRPTAALRTEMLGVHVPVHAQQFVHQVGQRALAFKLRDRPPPGLELSREDLERIGFSVRLIVRTS